MESDPSVLTLQNLVLLNQDVEPYLLTWPDGEEVDGHLEVKVLCCASSERWTFASRSRWCPTSRSGRSSKPIGMESGLL